MEHIDPTSLHPALTDPAMSNGIHVPPQHVGFVDTRYLLGMRGNNIRSWDTVNAIREDIRAGRGIANPIQVDQDVFGDGNAYVGEGNHRLVAAALEGVSHVPATMVRKKWGRNPQNFPRYPGRQLPGKGEKWDGYYHPAKAFPPGKVWTGDDVR
jgi:hypothetical protein